MTQPTQPEPQGSLLDQVQRAERRLDARRMTVVQQADDLRKTTLTSVSNTLHSPLLLGVAAVTVGAGVGLWAYRHHKAKDAPVSTASPPPPDAIHTRQVLSAAFTLANTLLTFMALRQQRQNSDHLRS